MNTIKNRVSLIGNLGGAPDIKTFDNGDKIANFSLATNSFYKNQKGENVQDTQWHNVVVRGKRAQAVEKYLNKGSKVAVDGRLVNRSYEKDGQKRYITEVVVNELLMLDQKTD